MGITSVTDYKNALDRSPVVPMNVGSGTVLPGRLYDLWKSGAVPGATPTTAVVPTNTTVGSLEQINGGTGTLSLFGARFSSTFPGTFFINDRLSHQGGLSGTDNTTQTTDLPTAALTRYTSGEAVMIGLSLYTAVGLTASSVTCSYTNQAGTTGRTTAAVQIGASNFRETNRLLVLPLAAGDSGARSVESVTLSASTATIGNIGVVLFKPLAAFAVESIHTIAAPGFLSGGMLGLLPEIMDGACLFPTVVSHASNGAVSGSLLIAEH